MDARSYVLFASPPSCLNIWSLDGVQQYTYHDAVVMVASPPDSSEFFLCAEEGMSLVAAPVESFNRVIKVNGTSVVLYNSLGGVCISFKNKTTLKNFAKSLVSILPALMELVDTEESIVADATSTFEDEMYSFLSELSATLLNDLSDLMVNNNSDVAADLDFDWDIVDL